MRVLSLIYRQPAALNYALHFALSFENIYAAFHLQRRFNFVCRFHVASLSSNVLLFYYEIQSVYRPLFNGRVELGIYFQEIQL